MCATFDVKRLHPRIQTACCVVALTAPLLCRQQPRCHSPRLIPRGSSMHMAASCSLNDCVLICAALLRAAKPCAGEGWRAQFGKCTAMQGLKCTDSNIQIPTSGLGQGGKVSLNAIVSSLLSPSASRASLSLSLSGCGCRTETSAKIPVAKQTDWKL